MYFLYRQETADIFPQGEESPGAKKKPPRKFTLRLPEHRVDKRERERERERNRDHLIRL